MGVDKAIQGQTGGTDVAYRAIRGREQNLIDHHGGAKTDILSRQASGNIIRGVSRANRNGRRYHDAALNAFGYLAPY